MSKKSFLAFTILQILILFFLIKSSSSPGLKISFLDVGQGDSIFLETAEGHRILIDGGPDNKVISQLEKVMPYFMRSIDLVVLTHPDKDHMYGILDVLLRYDVKNILMTDIFDSDQAYYELMGILQQKNIRVIIAEKNSDLKFGKLVLDILWPEFEYEYAHVEDTNDSSIVIMADYLGYKILLTGDLGAKIEKIMVDKGDLNSDILKVGHHGSKYSSSIEFLDAVKPDIAVIQAGKGNSYGHPHSTVIRNLFRSGVNKIYRTDENGLISLNIRP